MGPGMCISNLLLGNSEVDGGPRPGLSLYPPVNHPQAFTFLLLQTLSVATEQEDIKFSNQDICVSP